MSTYRARRACPSFPLTNFPTDVQLLILRSMDLHTIQNLTRAIPSAEELYLSYPSSVLRGALATMGPQTRNLLLTTYSLVCSIKSSEIYPQPDLSAMTTFLVENLDNEHPKSINVLEYDTMGALHGLCEIDAEITSLVEEYATDIYQTACKRHDAEAIILPLALSPIETRRITRAFYRLKLFGILFNDYPQCFNLDLKSLHTGFLDRLSTFEMDELLTAYNWMYTEQRNFTPAYVHRKCSHLHIDARHNRNNKTCRYCRGICAAIWSPTDCEMQTFFTTLIQKDYINMYELWAKPAICRETPCKTWLDETECNSPNDGWLLWCKVRDTTGGRVDAQEHTDHYKALGYCFWDSERLEGWDNMFREDWFEEERVKTEHYAWCDTCGGPCDT
jgi:hypothetical protein